MALRTLIAGYSDTDTANQVVSALTAQNFNRDRIRIIEDNDGDQYRSYMSDATHDEAPVNPEERTGFIGAAGAMVGLGGTLIQGAGSNNGAVIGMNTAPLGEGNMQQENMRDTRGGDWSGGTLVTIDIIDENDVERAQAILNQFNPSQMEERG